MLPIFSALGGAIARFGGPIVSGVGKLLGLGGGAAAGQVARAGGGLIGRAAAAGGRLLSNPFVGTAAGFGVGAALFGGEGGGGAGTPENIQAAAGDVIATLLEGGSDSMVKASWRVARAMGVTHQSLFAVISSLDMDPVDRMMVSNELERIVKPRRRRRSAVPKSIVRALHLVKAIQGMVSMRMRVKASRRGR